MLGLAKAHIELARKERHHYKVQCKNCKDDLEKEFKLPDGSTVEVPVFDPTPLSRNMTLHISFDFVQQVHIPSNPLQPGPIYFLTPRKCGIFGVCREGIQMQVQSIATNNNNNNNNDKKNNNNNDDAHLIRSTTS